MTQLGDLAFGLHILSKSAACVFRASRCSRGLRRNFLETFRNASAAQACDMIEYESFVLSWCQSSQAEFKLLADFSREAVK
jgi:hypothetical protein